MRLMTNGTTTLKVDRHLILSNGWEYYLEKQNDYKVAFGVVMGFETEVGDVYLPELYPYIRSEAMGETLNTLAPAKGWRWVE